MAEEQTALDALVTESFPVTFSFPTESVSSLSIGT
jgi:hypothetical protein